MPLAGEQHRLGRGRGRDYVLAVLTTDDPAGPGAAGLDYGISTIQGVSQRIWANLAAGPARGPPSPRTVIIAR